MAEIDSLEIKIQSDTENTNKKLDVLIGKLDLVASRISAIGNSQGFKNLFSQVQSISKSMSSVGTGLKNSMQSAEPQIQKISKTLADMEKRYENIGKGFTLKGSTEYIQKNIDSLTNQIAKATVAKESFEVSGRTDLPGYETAYAKVKMLTNQIESLKNQLASVSKTQSVIDIKIIGGEEAKATIEDFKARLSEFDNIIESGGMKTEAGTMFPVAALQNSLEQLRSLYPQAAELISSYEAEMERLNQITSAEKWQQFGNIDLSKFESANQSVKKLGDEVENFEEVLNSLKNIQPQINETNLTKLQNKLKSVEEQTEKLRYELEKGLRFGTINDKQFNNLTIRIKESENTAEALRKKIQEVGESTIKTAGSTSSLGSSFSKLHSNSLQLSKSIDKLGKNLNKTVSKMKSFTSQILRAFGIMGGLYGVIRGAISSVDIASDLTEVQNVVDVTFGDFKDKIESLADVSIPKFGMSELTAKEVASRFQSMGTAMGFAQDKMADMSVDITKLAADMASFYNVEQKDVAKSLESIFTGTTRPLRQYGIDLTQATLAEWAMKNGLDANIQSMSQAEKSMLRYQYVMAHTTAAQGDFQRTADTWANQIRTLKESFKELGGVIGGSLINAFKPFIKALNNAMSHVIAFAKTVSNALGKIFGWKYETGGGVATDLGDGAGYADDIAGGMNEAAGAAKKIRDYVLGIDELNIIAPEEPNGGAETGGTGGGGVEDYGYQDAVGAWERTESIFESNIDTLYKLGRHISDALSDAMENIDWNFIYKKAENFGSGLASFLNGLITPRLFYNLGKTVANSINTAFHAANAFSIEFDWKNLGNSLAKSIKGFFENWDAGLTAETFSNFAKGILESMTSFLNTLSDDDTFKDMGQKLVDFLCGIDWGGLAWNLIGFFKAFGNAIIDFPADFLEGAAQEIINKIFGEDTKIKVPENLGDNIFNGLLNMNPAFTGIKTAIDTLGELKDAFIDTDGNVRNFKDGFEELGEKLSEWDGIKGIEGLPQWIDGNVIKPISEMLKQLWNDASGFFSGLWEDISSLWITVSGWFSENVIEPVVSFFIGFSKRVQQIFEGLWLIIQAVWITVSGWFSENVITPVSELFATLWESIKEIWKIVSEWFNETVIIPVVNFFTELYITVSKTFLDLWDSIKKIWEIVYKWFDEKVISPIKNAFKLACDTISVFFNNLWEGIKKGVVGSMNAIISSIESAVNWIIDGVNNVISGFNKVAQWAANVAGKDYGGVDLVQKISLPRVSISGYELGGFPEPYSIFAAGEGGKAELLGAVGGKTAVAGGEEITGIRSAVYETSREEVSLLRDVRQLLELLLDKEPVQIGDREIARANYRGQKAMGVRIVHEM